MIRLAIVLVPIAGLILNGLVFTNLELGLPEFLAWDACFFIGIPVICILLLARLYRFPDLQILPREAKPLLIFGDILAATFFLGLVYFGSLYLLGNHVSADLWSVSYDFALPEPDSHAGKITLILYFAITGSVVEEIYYRRLLFWCIVGPVESRPRLVSYVVISSLLFSASHWEQGLHGMIATLLFGICAAVIYINYRYLLGLIVPHFLILFVSLYFA